MVHLWFSWYWLAMISKREQCLLVHAFTCRWGAWGKTIGVVVSVSEILLFLAPVSVTEYIPNFFFGGLMFW